MSRLIGENEIPVAGGQYFNIMAPALSDIDLQTIAISLSKQCRFLGHTADPDQFYSVAEHCVLMSRCFEDPGLAWQALLHDAGEAYIGDVIRPLKLHLDDYRGIEQRVEMRLHQHFELPWPLSPEIKTMDRRMLAMEKDEVCGAHDDIWPSVEGIEPAPVKPRFWDHVDARLAFISAYEQLKPTPGRWS